jgi:hypothetical protein
VHFASRSRAHGRESHPESPELIRRLAYAIAPDEQHEWPPNAHSKRIYGVLTIAEVVEECGDEDGRSE